ncbi:TIR domain-containing protein [Candidatus Latescibacterota bacterium]
MTSEEMVVLVTPRSISSEWVLTEWDAAWALGKIITPILLELSFDKLPDRLRNYQGLNFHDLGQFLDALVSRKREA